MLKINHIYMFYPILQQCCTGFILEAGIQLLNRLPASLTLNHLKTELEIAFLFCILGWKPTRGTGSSHFWFTRKTSTQLMCQLPFQTSIKQAMLWLISKNLCLTERLLKFALKKNSWNTQVFFPIHSLSLHIFIDHLLISLSLEKLR